MSGEPSGFDPQTLWQAQEKEYDPMTLAQIHQTAGAFERRIRRRNTIEYVGCVVVIAGFMPMLLHRGSWMMQLSAALTMAAAVFVSWQLHRRGSAQPIPQGDALIPTYRQELIRQRDALRSVFVWYLGPFIPGLALMTAGRWFQAHVPGRPLELDRLIIGLCVMIIVLAFGMVWLYHQRNADKLQKRIDEL
jgi:hypothetical protein